MRAIMGLVLATAVLGCGLASADISAPPCIETYLSQDSEWRLTVVPQDFGSPFCARKDKAAGRPHAGSTRQPLWKMEHRVQGRWQLVWKAPLVDGDGPSEAVVSVKGQTVTFGHSGTRGAEVIVIYGGSGQKLKALSLDDILPRDYVRALPRSVSSVRWGLGHSFSVDGRQLMLRVRVPQREADLDVVPPEYVQISVEAATGLVTPPEGPAWDRALVAAREVNTERLATLAREYEEFKAPLVAPAAVDGADWGGYLVEAYLRVVPIGNPDYPTVGSVPLGGPEFEERDRWLVRKAIDRVLETNGDVLVLGCPDPAQLIRALGKVVGDLPAGRLRRVQVYVAVTPALRAAAAQAIAPSGAAFVALNVTVPIPQVPERLKQLEQFQQGMESVR